MTNIVLVEPMAHSIGHYLPYALRLSSMLKKEYNNITLVTSEKIKDKEALKIIKANNIKNVYTNATETYTFKMISGVKKIIPTSLKRVLIFDYLHYKALQTANKENASDVFFMNTSFYLPLLYIKLFSSKNKRFLVYRISHPYKYKFLKFIRQYLFNLENIKTVYQNNKVAQEALEDISFDVDVLPNLASVEKRFDSKGDTLKVQYLFFGINHVGKDWKVFENVLNLLDEKYLKQIKFLFVGDIKKGDFNCDSPYDFNLKDRIDFEIIDTTGRYISQEEREEYFGTSDYIVVSFKKSFQLSSATLIDAISYNRPVVASRNYEITSFIEKFNSGILFDTSDEESLSKCIVESIEKKSLYKNINYDDFIRIHSFESIAKQIKNIFENIKGR